MLNTQIAIPVLILITFCFIEQRLYQNSESGEINGRKICLVSMIIRHIGTLFNRNNIHQVAENESIFIRYRIPFKLLNDDDKNDANGLI
ncbi:hypothetical protein DM784_04780 [Vibrio furnissii]|nr:hypothetical protein DM784_04780 [Vibrio furnissii]